MSFSELMFEVDFAFLNNHVLWESSIPVNPNTVYVGGLFCGPTRPLVKDLEDWIQGAENGVILVSFGSVSKRESFAFSSLFVSFVLLTGSEDERTSG